MFNFLAQLGRSPKAKYFMPTVAGVATFGYYSCHSYLHTFIRNLLAAQAPNGQREEVSIHLRKLIKTAYDDVKPSFNKPILGSALMETVTNPIKWFSSSTLEPITFGMSELNTGILIGLPNFYNYQKFEDMPDNVFEIRQLKLFRSPHDSELEEKEREELFTSSKQDNTVPLRKIDKNSPEGQDYVNSLLLSDDAKKFSIARELFMGDSYRPLARAAVIMLSFFVAISVGRTSVIMLKNRDAHITQRIPGYLLAGLFGYGNDNFLGTAINQYYAKKADERAIALGDSYKEGAAEYFSKRALRNKILGIE